jgi:outer membrane protein assembly factor BamB
LRLDRQVVHPERERIDVEASVLPGEHASTPIAVRVGNEDQIVVAGRRTSAFDPASGRELWSVGEAQANGNTTMASPVALGELVLVPSVDRQDMRALVALPEGEPELLWSRRSSDSIPSLLAHDQRVYFLRGDSSQLTVLDAASGEVEYGPERLEDVGEIWASPVLAGGRLYVAGRDGKVEVLALAPEVRKLAVNALDDRFDASPAVAGNGLFLRGRSRLYCLEEQGVR